MLDVVMAGLLLVIVVITVIVIVTLSPSASASSTTTESSTDDCIDVAVIGAGIGGAYTGWRLRDRGLSISVFEYTDRVGGRLFTAQLPVAPGTYLEFGGMRFQSNAQPIINRTVTELGLKIIPFEFVSSNDDETVWYLRGTRMRNSDLGTSRMPYNVDPSETKGIYPLLWDIFNNNVNFSSDRFSQDEIYDAVTSDGIPLYKMSLDNLYGRFASHEAYRYITEAGGWATIAGRQGAHTIAHWFAPSPPEVYETVEGGMDLVPQTLMKKFLNSSENHKLHLNHQLMSIEKREDGGYQLTFRRTKTTDGITTPLQSQVAVCARKVILAVPKGCIQQINFPTFTNNPEIVKNMDSVFDFPAGKVFLAYGEQWWKKNNSGITHTKSDFPNRKTYDWQTGTKNVSIIMASYHDGDPVHYWRELSQLGTPIPGSLPGANAVTDVVKKRLEKYLSLIYNYKQEDIPEAVGGGMMLWDSYPFSAAWSFCKPGVDGRVVQEMLLKPSPSDEVYIAGSSWTEPVMQGWSEGTLATVDKVLTKYFSI